MSRHTSHTRRTVLGTGSSMLFLAAAAAGAAKAQELDGELLLRCAVFHRTVADLDQIEAVDCDDEVVTAGVEAWYDAFQAVRDLPARTPEGLQAKARIAHIVLGVALKESLDPDDQTQEQRFALAVLDEVAGGRATV